MTTPQYPTFEDWWNEVESFSLRGERFYESMTQFSDAAKPVNVEVWIRAAFESARLLVDDNYSQSDNSPN